MVAIDLGGDLDLLLDAEDGFLEIQIHHVAQVRTAPCARTTGTTENIAEDVAKDVADIAKAVAAATATKTVLERLVAMLVVHRALLRVGQHFVGLLGLLEFLLRFRIVRAAVGMTLHRHATKCLFQVDLSHAALDTENFVVVPLAAHCFINPLPRLGAAIHRWKRGPSARASVCTGDDYFFSSLTSVNSASTTSSGWAEPPPGADCAWAPASAEPPDCAAAYSACATCSSLAIFASIADLSSLVLDLLEVRDRGYRCWPAARPAPCRRVPSARYASRGPAGRPCCGR